MYDFCFSSDALDYSVNWYSPILVSLVTKVHDPKNYTCLLKSSECPSYLLLSDLSPVTTKCLAKFMREKNIVLVNFMYHCVLSTY